MSRVDGAVIGRLRGLLASHNPREIEDPHLTPAAVTVLLYPKGKRYCVLMNRRSQQVRHHKGEIAFPGGEREPRDASLLETALREAHEEMGVEPKDVDLLGRLDDTPTISHFLIRPFVGVIPYPYPFHPRPQEVAQVLEVPLEDLLDPASRRDDVRVKGDALVRRPCFAHQGHLIFGATARILEELLGLVRRAMDEESPWSREDR